MNKNIIVIVLLAFLTAACTQPLVEEASPGSVENSFVYLMSNSAGDATINDVVTTNVTIVSTFVNDTGNTLTVYGRNSSGNTFIEIMTVSGTTTVASKNNTWEQIDYMVLNGSLTGTLTVADLGTGLTIATLDPGDTTAYNSVLYNGTNWVPPSLSFNSSVLNLQRTDEYVLYFACSNKTTNNVSVDYWVSPNNVDWFVGDVTLQSCAGTNERLKTTLTDKGVRHLKFEVTNNDVASNQVLALLVYK